MNNFQKLFIAVYYELFIRYSAFVQINLKSVMGRKCTITARQYGAFVLADAASGQSPVTPRQRGQKTVTVQGGHGAVFGVQVQIDGRIRVSRYNVDRNQISCHLVVV